MKVLLGILAVVGLLAGVFILFSGPSFGAGSDAPLGKFDKVDEFLQEGELEKAKPGKGDVKRLLGETIASRKDLIIWKYIGRAPGYPHFILVAAEAEGKIVAISGCPTISWRLSATTVARDPGARTPGPTV